jgi:hypothetical protein
MASYAIRDFCSFLSEALGFFDQPLVVGVTPLHGGTLGTGVTTRKE